MAGYPRPITTVVTAAASYSLIDLPTLKSELGVTDASLDAVLTRYIAEASAAIANYCNRVFPPETVSDQFYPVRDPAPRAVLSNQDPLQLSRYPIVDGQPVAVTENAVVLVAGTDFIADNRRGQLIRLDDLGYPRRWLAWPITVQYQAGFAVLPADLVGVAIRLIRKLYYGKDRDPLLRSETVPGVYQAAWWVPTGAEGGNLPPDIKEALDEVYRVPVTG